MFRNNTLGINGRHKAALYASLCCMRVAMGLVSIVSNCFLIILFILFNEEQNSIEV